MEAMTRPAGPAWLDSATESEGSERTDEDRWLEVFAALAHARLAALDELYDLAATDVYRLALWRTGSAEDAEDVVQEVFVRVAERCRQLASVRRPRAWLLTVAHRLAIDCCRRRNRREEDPVDSVPFLTAPGDDPERAADARTVSRLVGRLPAKQREVVLLRHFLGCTFREIARVTGVSLFTAASRHRLAVARLRRELEVDRD